MWLKHALRQLHVLGSLLSGFMFHTTLFFTAGNIECYLVLCCFECTLLSAKQITSRSITDILHVAEVLRDDVLRLCVGSEIFSKIRRVFCFDFVLT